MKDGANTFFETFSELRVKGATSDPTAIFDEDLREANHGESLAAINAAICRNGGFLNIVDRY